MNATVDTRQTAFICSIGKCSPVQFRVPRRSKFKVEEFVFKRNKLCQAVWEKFRTSDVCEDVSRSARKCRVSRNIPGERWLAEIKTVLFHY